MEVINDLPQDICRVTKGIYNILYDIFSRIPAEILVTLKAVCKLWQTIITDDQEFATTHLNRLRNSGEDYRHNHFLVNKVGPDDEQYDDELISTLQYVNSSGVGNKFQVKLDFAQLMELLQGYQRDISCLRKEAKVLHRTGIAAAKKGATLSAGAGIALWSPSKPDFVPILECPSRTYYRFQ
ncbi:hypothetical protein FRX31_015859 [Thalictrum thalictroides]|uniref:F-box domain-containing protein n=1 Tax=Thalictrum thalictroides TaxID=46969 RepID=A0A7J6WDW4_THATH|nr:hypothetical protein FRX31_015859 [Thalictrum thalictroides]